MTHDDWDDSYDDEDAWVDDADDPGEDESVPCPECGGEVPEIAGRCPACGYWITEADRFAGGTSQPTWLRVTAVIVLLAFLATLFGVGFSLF